VEVDKASSLVLLRATLAATITYQAGLSPPGGVWPENADGHMAGDPILLTTNPGRFKVFFYSNSIAFVASLVAIILVHSKPLLQTHVLEAAMILDLFGLIGAYAAGSCRDVSSSIYAMALAGAVLVYVVIHVVFFTLDKTDTMTGPEKEVVEKRRKRLLLFAVLAATITYQAGLTPPGGFRLQDDGDRADAGDPVLLYNSPPPLHRILLLQLGELHVVHRPHHTTRQPTSIQARHKKLCALYLLRGGHVCSHGGLCCRKHTTSQNIHLRLRLGGGGHACNSWSGPL
jgi:hypothetical protein